MSDKEIYSREEQSELLGLLENQPGFAEFRKRAQTAVNESGAIIVKDVDTDSEPLLVALAAIFGYVDAEGNGFPNRTVSEIRHVPGKISLNSKDNGRFAPHTDSTFMVKPHRYLIMGVVEHDPDGQGETTLMDGYGVLQGLTDAEARCLRRFRVPFSVDGRAESPRLAVPILADRGGRTMIRYRADVIVRDALSEEASEESWSALQKFERLTAEHPSVSRTFLERGSVIIIDNWRVLHGRDHFPNRSPRLLKRLKVKSI
ncbi:TauD/TfdA family dioxygenase [Streptomyces sp. AC550_RSS872]|uniref:TauD/TfdA family dioxygenase n=1 Tax=Streptomyces sp. AC550_RSS872 TaxID=2823689 RepID=UPI001C276789|nr:TauD/TfdA family dioxygenase [Streptomyces sp. AC550_RSS872]